MKPSYSAKVSPWDEADILDRSVRELINIFLRSSAYSRAHTEELKNLERALNDSDWTTGHLSLAVIATAKRLLVAVHDHGAPDGDDVILRLKAVVEDLQKLV